MKTRNTLTLLATILVGFLTVGATRVQAQGQMIGINVHLNQPPSNSILQDLGRHGQVLDVISQINGVTLRARSSELSTIQSLPYVAGANPDTQGDLMSGTNFWSLDAVNVTDFATGRTVGYDGTGIYIAVIDTGLPFNWRAYFPEERIAVQYARGFGGGGVDRGTVSSQPQTCPWSQGNRAGSGAFEIARDHRAGDRVRTPGKNDRQRVGSPCGVEFGLRCHRKDPKGRT